MDKKKVTPFVAVSFVILTFLTILFIFPFYWIITGAFKSLSAAVAVPPQWFPAEPTLENFVTLFKNPAARWMFKSIFIAGVTMLAV